MNGSKSPGSRHLARATARCHSPGESRTSAPCPRNCIPWHGPVAGARCSPPPAPGTQLLHPPPAPRWSPHTFSTPTRLENLFLGFFYYLIYNNCVKCVGKETLKNHKIFAIFHRLLFYFYIIIIIGMWIKDEYH